MNFLLLENTNFNNTVYYGLAKESNLLKKIDEWFDLKKQEYFAINDCLKTIPRPALQLIQPTLNEYYIIKRSNCISKGYIYNTIETKTEVLNNLTVINCKNTQPKNVDLIRTFIKNAEKTTLVNLIENLLISDNEIIIKNLINSIQYSK